MDIEEIKKQLLSSIVELGLEFATDTVLPWIKEKWAERHPSEGERHTYTEDEVTSLVSELVREFSTEDLLGREYKTVFAGRLDQVFQMMESAGVEMNIAVLSDMLGNDSANEIKQYYTNDKEPTTDVIDEVADALGVNADFLSGKTARHPFATKWSLKETDSEWEDLDGKKYKKVVRMPGGKDIADLSAVFCLDQDDKVVRFALVEGGNDCRYICYRFGWEFNGNVKGSPLESAYALIERLVKTNSLSQTDYAVHESEFDALCEGDIYPHAVVTGRPADIWHRNTFDILVDSIDDPNGKSAGDWQEMFEPQFENVRRNILAI